jgi:peptidoglycan/LPS O-acetylase OafA/YrhL
LYPQSQQHRSDVDGLRGAAVLLVLLYHLRVPGFGGGFSGVDVFFVISGFVVTRLIARELVSGDFSLRAFYARRFWRLWPMFLLMAAVTLLAGAAILAPPDLYGAARSALAALTLSANFYFLQSTTGYATQLAENEPFLHTWSLAVEEQFYLLWPVLVCLGVRIRLLRHRLVIAGALAGLLALSHWLARESAAAAYYLLPARLVELGLGALLVKTEGRSLPRAAAHALGGLGLSAVVAAALWLDPHGTFPGLPAMLPCLGTAALIQAGPSGSFVTRLLAARAPVALGRISYSFYLWHWPCVAFLNYTSTDLTPSLQLSVGAGTLALSWASYRFWESPARTADARPLRRLTLALAVCLIAGIGLTIRPGALTQVAAAAVEKRLGGELQYKNLDCLFAAATWADIDQCNQGLDAQGFPPVKARPGAKRVLVWGDSHARQWGSTLRQQGERLGVVPTIMAVGGCPPLLGVHRADPLQGKTVCNEALGEHIRHFLARHRFDLILVVARFGIYENGWHRSGKLVRGREHFVSDTLERVSDATHSASAVHRRLRTTLDYLTALRGTRVIFVLPTPDLHDATRRGDDLVLARAKHLAARAAVADIAEAAPRSLHVLDVAGALCDADACHARGPEGPLYGDDNHLSALGMARVLPLLESALAGAPPEGR